MGPWQIFLFLLLCGFSMASPETGKRRSPEDPTPGGYNAAPPIPNIDDDTVARLIIGPNPWVLFLYREEHLTNANPDIKMLLIAVVFRQFVPRRVVRLAGPNVGLSITHELDHRLVTQFPGLTISDTQLVAPDGIDAEFMTLIAGRMWATQETTREQRERYLGSVRDYLAELEAVVEEREMPRELVDRDRTTLIHAWHSAFEGHGPQPRPQNHK